MSGKKVLLSHKGLETWTKLAAAQTAVRNMVLPGSLAAVPLLPLLGGAGGAIEAFGAKKAPAVNRAVAPLAGAAGAAVGEFGGAATGLLGGAGIGSLGGAAIGALIGAATRTGFRQGAQIGAMYGATTGGVAGAIGGGLYGAGKGYGFALKKALREHIKTSSLRKSAYGGLSYPTSGATPTSGLPGVGTVGRAIGSMKKGGDVKKTGLYKLHKGEKVIPADQVKKKSLKFTAKHDDDPGLKGNQSKLPDAVQEGILKKASESRRNAILIQAALMARSGK